MKEKAMTPKLNTKYIEGTVAGSEIDAIWPQIEAAHCQLLEKSGPGCEFLGWLDLPVSYDKDEYERIKKAAAQIRKDCEVLVVIGIGGSYLGARAAIEFIKSPMHNQLGDGPEIYFAGNTISPSALSDILRICEGRELCLNVISKSGTTTEPALAFRVFRSIMEKKYGREEAARRIYCTTDKSRGTLRELADKEGYETFVIPDDIGGRFSVLTAVGLLPIAAAGCDLDALMKGAADARESLHEPERSNDAYIYAAIRNILYRKGMRSEVLVGYEPALAMTAEWFKQLFGESEGKDKKGLLPCSMIFSTDLHSLGQYVQDGSRILFETVLNIGKAKEDFFLEEDPENLDGLNFLSGRNMSEVNHKAMQGTLLAHVEGGAPNLILEIPRMDEYNFGFLVYFFEKTCAISGYVLGVNPFDQPGVESYKKNMFALLGKPGYEDLRTELEAKLS